LLAMAEDQMISISPARSLSPASRLLQRVVICRFFCDEQTGKEYQHALRRKTHKNAYQKSQKTPRNDLLAANVANIGAIVLTSDSAHKSVERAGIFNTLKFLGNICPSSRSATKSDALDARQKRAKTRHFLLISSPSRPKVRAERPCWKRSIRLKY
jgi:hypothetical protein